MKTIFNTALADKCFKKICVLGMMTCLSFSGCKKYIEVDAPDTSINAANVYEDDALASAVLTGIYTRISATFDTQQPNAVSVYTELTADNLNLINVLDKTPTYRQHYQNALTKNIQFGTDSFWKTIFPVIYSANAAIEGLSGSKSLNPLVKQRLLGEAYFLRAYFYFTLVNLYGDVPLFTTSIFQTNIEIPRTPVISVYQQIVDDLNQAKNLLDNRYVDATVLIETSERVRPNRMAALALLARTQLYRKEYVAAEAAATEVIEQSALYKINLPLNDVFLKNSPETIWALQPVKDKTNTDEGGIFILPASGPDDTHSIYISDRLMKAFEPGDLRKKAWIDSVIIGKEKYPFPAKYKVTLGTSEVTEYPIILRLAEQYLIRAEARNEQNNVSGAVSDLNILRTRARAVASVDIKNPLPELSSTLTQIELRDKILRERRVELFTEGGHRWFDLIRSGKVNEVMSIVTPLKGGAWAPYKMLYPVPLSEILSSHVLTQNPGYN